MVVRRKEQSSAFKSPVNRKRPEKVAPAKRNRNTQSIAKRSRAIKKRPVKLPSGHLAANQGIKRIVLLDACNLSHYKQVSRGPRFSVERLSRAFSYFVDRGHEVYAVFPRFHLYTNQWDDTFRLQGLYKKNYIVVTPCKEQPNRRSQVYDDRILMAMAAAYNCAVVSNDRFRDMAYENSEWERVANTLRVPFDWDREMKLIISQHSLENVLTI